MVAVVVVIAAFALLGVKPTSSSGSKGSVLVRAGTLFSIPFEQYDAVEFVEQSPVIIQATLTNIGGMQLYVMSPSDYLHLVLSYNVSGYQWTSGPVSSDTYYHLDVTIPVGSWDLVFANSVWGNSTAVGFYSNLVENS